MNSPTIASIIPVRGGSKRIKNKNIKDLNGKPLLYYTLDLAINNEKISEIFVTTECENIINLVNQYNTKFNSEIQIIKRPVSLAQDDSTTEDTLIHAISMLNDKFDFIMLLPATAPFRRNKDINDLVDSVIKYNVCSGQTISKKKLRLGTYSPPYYNYEVDSKEIDMKKLKLKYVENSCLYLFKPTILLETGKLQSEDNIATIMDTPYDLDINDKYDWYFAEYLLEKDLLNE